MKKRIILGSNSPRRQHLLREVGIDFEVRIKKTDEHYPPSLPVYEVAEYLARLKAAAFEEDMKNDEVVITADTTVICGQKLYEKAANAEEAQAMLSSLSGKSHLVITGVTITSATRQITFSSETEVFFRHLTRDEIQYYIETCKPFDKAGAYGIQEWIGMVGIEKIVGSYYNVVGLPVDLVYLKLRSFLE